MGVACNVEISKIELPDEGVFGAKCGEVAVGVGESETELD